MQPKLNELAASLAARLGSQEKLAEAIGTSQSVVSGWIAGGGAVDVAELALLRLSATIDDRIKILGAFLALRISSKAPSFDLVTTRHEGANMTARKIDRIFNPGGGKFAELAVVQAVASELAAYDLTIDGDYLVFRMLEDRFTRPGAERVVTFNLNEECLEHGLGTSWRR